MPPRSGEIDRLVLEWLERAAADLEVAQKIASEYGHNVRMREITGFHCQQAAEKYLKGLLTQFQIEFPKTHDIKALLDLSPTTGIDAESLHAATWLSPFGVAARYPSEGAEMLVGEEIKALEIAVQVRAAVLDAIASLKR